MSKFMNRGKRTKTARESYIEQLPYDRSKKRKPFTNLHSSDDIDLGYQSTPEYLKQFINTNGHAIRNITRTKSVSEFTSENNLNRTVNGNPKYKPQEDYYDEVQLLKKELKYVKEDNGNIRAKLRRLEEDNARKCKEIDSVYNTNKDGDARYTSGSSPTNRSNIPPANALMNLKQRVFKLELQLKQKEMTIDEMKNNPRWTKGTELEIQNRALFNELERQKFARLNYIHENDYMASIDEEKKNAVRKLESQKHELRIENENLKKKLRDFGKLERGEQLSAREYDGSSDKDLHRKIDDLNQECKNYQNELHHMKEDIKKLQRQRDHYRKELEQVNNDFEDLRHKYDRQSNNSMKSSSTHMKPYESPRRRHDSSSGDERSKKESRPHTPIKKSNEYIDPRSSKAKLDRYSPPPSYIKKSTTSLVTSSQNLRRNKWTSDDDKRVKSFREKRAATVIQRGWRQHNKFNRYSSKNRTKQNSFDKYSSETHSPRSSQQKLGSKINNLGSGNIPNRPLSANISTESAIKTVQASLRGHQKRTDMDQTTRQQKFHGNDDDIHGTSARQYGYERKRDSYLDHPKRNLEDNTDLRHDKMGSNNRDSSSKLYRSPASPTDIYRSSPARIGGYDDSKQTLPNDRNKLGSGNRFSINERDSTSKLHRGSSPPADPYRSSSPYTGGDFKQTSPKDRNKLESGNQFPINERDSTSKLHRASSPPADPYRSSSPYAGRTTGSKQALPNDKDKYGSSGRIDRDPGLKLQRPYSPSNDHRSFRPDDISLRKNLPNSRQSLRSTHKDDDDDVV